MKHAEYLAARNRIENMGLTPENIAGTLVHLDRIYVNEGGTPISPSEGGKRAAEAIAGAAARSAAISKLAREHMEQNRLAGTPISPGWATEFATACVDAPDPFAGQREGTIEDYDTQAAADAEDKAASLATFSRLQAEAPQRDAAAADLAGRAAEVEDHRRVAVAHGSSYEQAAERYPDAVAGPAPEPSSLERQSAALFGTDATQ